MSGGKIPEPAWKTFRRQRADPDDIRRHFQIEPPVDVFGLARRMGIKVTTVPEAPWSGSALVQGNVAQAWVNGSEAKVRQRFTLAHEIGHIIMHPEGVQFRDIVFSAREGLEAEANQFAAELLMPAAYVEVLARDNYNGNYKLLKTLLANHFRVSEPAMGIRISKVFGAS